MSFCYLNCKLWPYSTPFSSISVVENDLGFFLALQIFISLLDACIVYSTHLELMLNSIFPVIRMMYLAIDLVGEISTLYQRSSWHYIVSEEKTLMKNLPISYMPITYPLHTFIHRYTCMLISAWKFKWIFRMIFQYVINGFHE